MPKTLILLTNAFPYGNKETYLETEVKYYTEEFFSDVHIFALNITKEKKDKIRKIPSKRIEVYPVFKAPGYTYILFSIVALLDKHLYHEIGKLAKQKNLFSKSLIKLFIYFSRAHYEACVIKKYLKNKGMLNSKKEGIIYSYRFDYQPYVGILIKKYLPAFKIISRAHRYDLYEEFNDVSYIPMRETLLEKLDRIILISDDGYQYLKNKFPKYGDKLFVSRLGTTDSGKAQVSCSNGEIHLVSCSNVVPVKRLDLLVESLSTIRDYEVYWTHYGDGQDLERIKQQCRESLKENIHYNFPGSVSNTKIINDYVDNTYHLFVNVSSSEGIPVSIMEAMSVGMPCIATDVGGTNEIVEDNYNGVLLNADFTPEELAKVILRFANMGEKEYQDFRRAARNTWEGKYNAEKNYLDFVKKMAEGALT